MNIINPYRRNCEVLRRFFAKPVLLVLGIAFCISIIFELLSGSLNLMAFFPVITFFMFYFRGRSNNPAVSFKTPTALIKTYSIISVVLYSLFFCYSLCMIFYSFNTGTIESAFELATTNFVYACTNIATFFILPETIIGLLFFSALLKTTSSLKKSQNTIYLHSKGSVFLAVTSIIFAVYYITSIFTLSFHDELQRNFAETASDYIAYYGFNNLITASVSNVFTIASYIIKAFIYILFAVLGLSYNSYIKNLVTSIGSENINTYFNTAPQVTAKNIQNEYSPMSMWDNPLKVSDSDRPPVDRNAVIFEQPKPVKFEPQHVSFTPIPSSNPVAKETHVETIAEIPVEPVKETPKEIPVEIPAEPVSEGPTETPVNIPAESVTEEPAEIPVDIPAEPITEASFPDTPGSPTQAICEIPAVHETRFCHICGKECPPDFIFCSGCGTKLYK